MNTFDVLFVCVLLLSAAYAGYRIARFRGGWRSQMTTLDGDDETMTPGAVEGEPSEG